MSDQTRRTAVVTLAVYPATKEEWEAAAENDPNADSLSQLVRVAVNRYLNEQFGDSSRGVSQDVHEQLTELNSQYGRLASEFDELKGQLTDIRDEVTGTTVGPEIEALAEDVFEALPSKQEAHTESVLSESGTGVPAPKPGTVEWLATQFEAPQYHIQSALDHLQETTYAVQQTADGQYYKEV